jgi:hypothetical protein
MYKNARTLQSYKKEKNYLVIMSANLLLYFYTSKNAWKKRDGIRCEDMMAGGQH